jgi:hypothetical protein
MKMNMNMKDAVNYCSTHEKCVIHTPAWELYNKLMEYLGNLDCRWLDNISSCLLYSYRWYESNTCVFIDADFKNADCKENVQYGNYAFFEQNGYKIIELEENIMQFEIGDKVRVVDSETFHKMYTKDEVPFRWNSAMEKYMGKVGKVTDTMESNAGYQVEFKINECFIYAPEALLPAQSVNIDNTVYTDENKAINAVKEVFHPWPADYDIYYYIDEDGKVEEFRFNIISTCDRKLMSIGNFYKTKEEAELALERVLKAYKG